MLEIVLLSGAAGIIGTGLGGMLGLIFGGKSEKVASYLLSFAAGVMLGIVFFDLAPESISLAGTFGTVISIIGGVGVVWLLNLLIDVITNSRALHASPAELRHQEGVAKGRSRSGMLRSGLIMFAAIALHNLPEGMAIGSGGAHDSELGLTLALLIAIHNIPEGVSIGVPLIEGGMNKWKAVMMTALSGAPTFLGGAIGAAMGGAGDLFVGLSMGIAAGAMLYVTFCEILPQAVLLDQSRKPALFSVAGALFGLIIITAL